MLAQKRIEELNKKEMLKEEKRMKLQEEKHKREIDICKQTQINLYNFCFIVCLYYTIAASNKYSRDLEVKMQAESIIQKQQDMYDRK
jgi:hypothetical protein